MTLQPLKLAGISLQNQASTPQLQQCEELYIYGVLSQLARFSELQYRDLATLTDRIELEDSLDPSDLRTTCHQICLSTRTQFLLIARLATSEALKSDFHIGFQLYEARSGQYRVEQTALLSLDTESMGDGDTAGIPVFELNRVINETVCAVLKAIYPERSLPEALELPEFSQSLPAMKLILKAHKTQNAAEKIACYESALREDIKLETAYYHLARLYKNELAFEKSILFFRETLKISRACPRNKAIYATEAGVACALLGRSDLALQWWQRAIEYDSQYINPYFNIAHTYEDMENYAASESYFLKAQVLAPDDFRTFLSLARVYSKMGVWDKALTQYQCQLSTEESDPWCHSDLATCYLNLGDVENARLHLQRTVDLDPEGEAGQYAQLILGGLSV